MNKYNSITTLIIAAVAAGLAVSYVAAKPERAEARPAAAMLRFLLRADKDAQNQCDRMNRIVGPYIIRCEGWFGTCIRRPRGGRGPVGPGHAYCTLHAFADGGYKTYRCDRYVHYAEIFGFIRFVRRFSDPRWYCTDDFISMSKYVLFKTNS